MDIPHGPFEEWRTRHLQELTRDYRHYLRDILDDDGFDITNVEDFYMWAGAEYEILRDAEEQGQPVCMYNHDHSAQPELCEWHD